MSVFRISVVLRPKTRPNTQVQTAQTERVQCFSQLCHCAYITRLLSGSTKEKEVDRDDGPLPMMSKLSRNTRAPRYIYIYVCVRIDSVTRPSNSIHMGAATTYTARPFQVPRRNRGIAQMSQVIDQSLGPTTIFIHTTCVTTL